MSDQNMRDFYYAMEEVNQRTNRMKKTQVETWKHLRQRWIKHYGEIPEALIRQRTELLIAIRYTECFQTYYWIEWLVLRGGYYQALRELRSILESVIQAYCIDKEYQDIGIHEKLDALKEMIRAKQGYGGRLIKRASPPEQKDIMKLYQKLSSFVHSSVDYFHRLLGTQDSDGKIVELTIPKFDAELFEKCCDLSKQVMEHIININRALIKILH